MPSAQRLSQPSGHPCAPSARAQQYASGDSAHLRSRQLSSSADLARPSTLPSVLRADERGAEVLPSNDQIEETIARAETAAIITDPTTDAAPVGPVTAGVAERIIDGNELSNINYLMLGLVAARSVGRIIVRRDGIKIGNATGFLTAPGVLVTNEHVFPNETTVADSSVQFRYEVDALGEELEPVEFRLLTNPAPLIDKDHDLTVVAVEPKAVDGISIDRFGWLHLDPAPAKSDPDEFLTIIQHPKGQRKQICIRENRLLKFVDERHVTYTSDTVPGSSGSPVFNNRWDVVALHHSGVPKSVVDSDGRTLWVKVDGTTMEPPADGMIREELDLQWLCNEGVRMSAIAAALAAHGAGNELATRVLAAPAPPKPPPGPWPGDAWRAPDDREGARDATVPSRGRVETTSGVLPALVEPGTSKVVVPIELTIGVRAGVALTPGATGPGGFVERFVTADDFDDRVGYKAAFLGSGLRVPLPKLSEAQKSDLTEIAGGGTVLKYGTFSVVMCSSRGLAFFSAANVDRDAKGTSKRAGITWEDDPRLESDAGEPGRQQIGSAFYEHQQLEDVVDPDERPFDQGHLTRFADTNWGPKEKRNGVDSFHFPNCAPQHKAFNQGSRRNGIWFRLEDWAGDLSDTGKFSVINGPIFDGPPSREVQGKLELQVDDPGTSDPVFGGVSVPKQYFKVIVFEGSDGELAVQAFVVTQEDVLQDVETLEEGLSDAELRLYRVPMKVVEQLTGLDFGPLSAPGVSVNEGAADEIELITDLEQL